MSESEISFAMEAFNHPQSADLSDMVKATEIAVKCFKEQRRPHVYLDDVYRTIAGHSDYHGDDILAALASLSEGKEVSNIKPITKKGIEDFIKGSLLDVRPNYCISLEKVENMFDFGKAYEGDDIISAITQVSLGYDVGKVPSIS